VRLVHKQTYAPSVANIATLVFEDLGGPPDPQAIAQHRQHMSQELEGVQSLEGTYPFTQARSQANLKINAFLHDLVKPAHRERFVHDFKALAQEYGLSQDEQDLIEQRDWLALVRRGVSFFVLEKMAAVLGVSNPQVYAAFRGETLEQFLATRKAAITYSVAGQEKT
jgi:gallate dioxygenase